MRMAYFVAHDLAHDEVGSKSSPLRKCDLLRHLKIRPYIVVIPDPAAMFLGDDLGMSRGLRVDIEECHEVGVFVDDIRGYLSCDDLTEDAGRKMFHARILQVSLEIKKLLSSIC